MALFEKMLRRELAEMHREEVQISFIGDLSALPQSLQRELHRAIDETYNNQAIHFSIATNYGSRSEIVNAIQQIAELVQRRTPSARSHRKYHRTTSLHRWHSCP